MLDVVSTLAEALKAANPNPPIIPAPIIPDAIFMFFMYSLLVTYCLDMCFNCKLTQLYNHTPIVELHKFLKGERLYKNNSQN
ncbi:hypothetical protein SOASR015_31310 [Pectobacterium carotovorum subsp. carotovorum]|nr:hypothetical protein SOASR015_31310 [Pectobacterium carotovorum subsp. carotovorum]